jgi:arylsulfatase A-like enzyme
MSTAAPTNRLVMLLFPLVLTTAAVPARAVSAAAPAPASPNIIVLFADDLGYGDLACYGHPTIRTPELDRMAAEGMRFTQFYSGAPVCTPSRAALLTGRLPVRSGLTKVLFPTSQGGLPDHELTLAEALQSRGYATCCVGKWHLGHHRRFLPTRHGFDHYFGIPYSNDMDVAKRGDPPIPLMRDERIIEQPAEQETLTLRYTAEVLRFIRDHRDGAAQGHPFFLYLPYTFPHVPLHTSKAFRGKSPRGLYGDVVEEIDWSVGQILKTLRDEDLAGSTLVFFSSDNGPWLIKREEGGSAGSLREGKGSTWEGGLREPCIAWWPGRIPAGRVARDLAATMDLFATCLELAGVEPPNDRPMDGVSLRTVLLGTGSGLRTHVFYYREATLMAVRKGPWKLHFKTINPSSGQDNVEPHDPPLLFHLGHDPAERQNIAAAHPAVIADLLKDVEQHRCTVKAGEPQK